MTADSVAVWSPWRLHRDAVVEALTLDRVDATPVDDPDDVGQLLVADAAMADRPDLIVRRRTVGRQTVIWGATLLPPQVQRIREAGATAYLPLLCSVRDLVATVRLVQAGGAPPWPPLVEMPGELTPAQRRVAHAYLVTWLELPRSQVAQRLGMSERTLKVHVANIRDKVGGSQASSREGLRRALVVRGWLDLTGEWPSEAIRA